jgi:hypothetical protein
MLSAVHWQPAEVPSAEVPAAHSQPELNATLRLVKGRNAALR